MMAPRHRELIDALIADDANTLLHLNVNILHGYHDADGHEGWTLL